MAEIAGVGSTADGRPAEDPERLRVFLSYRRSDDRHLAGRLRDLLAVEFGEDNVFFDVDSIPAGEDFRVTIREYIDEVDVMLALIGPRWEPSRLAANNDFVRVELVEALQQAKPVIPVLIDDTPMPSPDQLPDELAQLAYLNARVVRPDPDFRSDAARVAKAVRIAHHRTVARRARELALQQEGETQAELAPARAVTAEAADELRVAREAADEQQAHDEAQADEAQAREAGLTQALHTPTTVRAGWSKRARWWMIAGCATLVAVAVVSVLLPTRGSDDPRLLYRLSTDRVRSVAWSPDGTKIAGAADTSVRVWDAVTGTTVGQPFTGHTDVVCGVAWSPDGIRIASASWDRTVQVSDAATGKAIGQPFTGDTTSVCSVTWSPDGTKIATDSYKTVRVRDAATGTTVDQLVTGDTEKDTDQVEDVAWSPDGTKIAGSRGHSVWVWDAATGSLVGQPFTGHTDLVVGVAWSPDGTKIASGGWDETVRVSDAATGAPVGQAFTGHTNYVRSVAWSPDGTKIASGSWDKTVRVWDAATGAPVGQPFTGHTADVNSVAWSPDGTKLASSGDDNTVRVWDASAPRSP